MGVYALFKFPHVCWSQNYPVLPQKCSISYVTINRTLWSMRVANSYVICVFWSHSLHKIPKSLCFLSFLYSRGIQMTDMFKWMLKQWNVDLCTISLSQWENGNWYQEMFPYPKLNICAQSNQNPTLNFTFLINSETMIPNFWDSKILFQRVGSTATVQIQIIELSHI